MCKLAYLPIAKKDIEDIIFYISEKLNAPKAALNLLGAFESKIENLKEYPYLHEIHNVSKLLGKEYRYIPVKSYIIFYKVLENIKTVEIQRILYGKMDISKII